mgnify:CR=1 FL=1
MDSNITDSIDSISKELQSKADQYFEAPSAKVEKPVPDASEKFLDDRFFDAYPQPKPPARILGYIPLKK